jgi:tetratricopeptide (TPR) repeat protein
LETLNKGFGLGFDNAEIFNERADILLHLARFAEARDDARRAIALDPNDCLPYMSLAQALAKLGDEEGFYSNLETALRKHCKVWKYTQQPGLFEYRNTARFKKLMRQYQE